MIKTIKKMLGMNGAGDEIIGSISTFAGRFAPMGFMDCDGRVLQAKEHPALYSILGTTYGGDGTTFALPDLRPFANDGQPDTGRQRKVDWNEVKQPRQVICVTGIYPMRD
jgi:microcystin-dependent protein